MNDFVIVDLKEIEERRKKMIRRLEYMLADRRENLRRTEHLLTSRFMTLERRAILHRHADELHDGMNKMKADLDALRATPTYAGNGLA